MKTKEKKITVRSGLGIATGDNVAIRRLSNGENLVIARDEIKDHCTFTTEFRIRLSIRQQADQRTGKGIILQRRTAKNYPSLAVHGNGQGAIAMETEFQGNPAIHAKGGIKFTGRSHTYPEKQQSQMNKATVFFYTQQHD